MLMDTGLEEHEGARRVNASPPTSFTPSWYLHPDVAIQEEASNDTNNVTIQHHKTIL